MSHQKSQFANPKVWAASARAILVLILVGTGPLSAQQDAGPVLKPKKATNKPIASATLLVTCDLACNWKLDGEVKGRIEGGSAAKATVELGQHLIVAATDDGLDQIKQLSEVKGSGQTVVSIELQPVRNSRLKAEQETREKAVREEQERDHQEKERSASTEERRKGAVTPDALPGPPATPIQPKDSAVPAGELATAPVEKGTTIYLINRYIHAKVYCDERLVARDLSGNRYMTFETSPGKHVIAVENGKNNFLTDVNLTAGSYEISAVAGQDIFLKTDMKNTALHGKFWIIRQISEDEGKKSISHLKIENPGSLLLSPASQN